MAILPGRLKSPANMRFSVIKQIHLTVLWIVSLIWVEHKYNRGPLES